MKKKTRRLVARAFTCLVLLTGCAHPRVDRNDGTALIFPGEDHFANLRQLTFGGTNAEAYWSFNPGDLWLTFQHKGPGLPLFPGDPAGGPECDQIYKMKMDGTSVRRLSNGKGRTTCSFFMPETADAKADSRVVYASTDAYESACPAPPDMSKGYVWPVFPTFQLFSVKSDGTDRLPLEPAEPKAYNAEATFCKDGSVLFTSDRNGDLDLYLGKLDRQGTLADVKQITKTPGYDGGAVFSPDCSKIAWRASRPRPGKELDEYADLLKNHLVKPTDLEIWVANRDGTHAHQVSDLHVASFAPAFTPDGKRLIFASNPRDPHGRSFDLYLVNLNGTGLERLTYSNTFESFPMFSPDGKYLAFSSNRAARQPHETNVFVAEWVDQPTTRTTVPPPVVTSGRQESFLAAVSALSTPEMEGRGVTGAALSKAEDWVANRYAEIGLRPFFDVFKKASEHGQGYFHQVDMQIKPGQIVRGRNVLGVLEGSPGACQGTAPVVVGAHLDHLGKGEISGSLESAMGKVHPGADDNASGVAGVLQAAREIAPIPRKSCLIFAAFTGEEIGTAGSGRLVELFKTIHVHPKAMLNLDMVGRMESNTVIVYGTESALQWQKRVDASCVASHLNCPGGGDGFGPSDHMPFYVAGVPVLHFFTGPHEDYHRVTDTADKINATGGVQVASLVTDLARQSLHPGLRLTYQKSKSAPTMGGLQHHGRGTGAYLGTIPDYAKLTSPHGLGGGTTGAGVESGVPLAGVRATSPAEQAGLKAGDILTAIIVGQELSKELASHDSKAATPEANSRRQETRTLDDFMSVLMELKPTQRIYVEFMRDGTKHVVPATVGKR